ncbi:MAG: hypothetical protein ACM3NV_01825 [Syntrophothermus sp.]
MSEERHRIDDLERRVAELRRTNDELGRELVAARAGSRPVTANTAGRAVARLTHARDAAVSRERASHEELEWLRRENAELKDYVERLKLGPIGFLRRVIARAARG